MKPIEDMSKAEVIAALTELNPFGGYSERDRVEGLRATLDRYLNRRARREAQKVAPATSEEA